MIDPASHSLLRREIHNRIQDDYQLLQKLRAEVRPLRTQVRRIQARETTSISLVGTDGGNNRVQFDPFLIQLVRVVDSSNNEYCLEAITPSTSVRLLGTTQFDKSGKPFTPVGKLMDALDVGTDLTKLSHMIRLNDEDRPTSPSWVQVYRELMEWAVLLTVIRDKDFGTDTMIVCDGLLRSKVFAQDLFRKFLKQLEEAIAQEWNENRRRIFLVGLAKHSKVLDRYRLAMALERVLTTEYPAYLAVPQPLEEAAYVWSEYARGDDEEIPGGEINKFVGGKMHLVKFGSRPSDPIWPVDIFLPQRAQAQVILGCLLADSVDGFPIPFYPRCLQRAHENAALVDFDFDVLQDQVLSGLRDVLAGEATTLDAFQFQDVDTSGRRY